jgi:hypothetical protein
MPPAIDTQSRAQVIKKWLSGHTRDEISEVNNIGAGTVSNIINEWKKALDSTEYDSLRELSVFLKKEGITLNDLASLIRLNNYIKKLGAEFGKIESFIANIASVSDPQKLIDTANQVVQISKIPLDKIPDHIKQQQDEIQRIKEGIEKAGAILEEKNIDVQTIDEYKNLKEELEKYGFSMESPRKLVSVLLRVNQMGYDPIKIVKELAWIKSLKRLKNEYTPLELRAARYREVLPMCEQIMKLRIGFSELVAFHTAVMKRADSGNIPMESAAYRVMEEIENYQRIMDLREVISNLLVQKYTIEQFCTERKRAILSLINLQSFDVKDEEILNIHEFMIRARLEKAARMSHSSVNSLPFNSYGRNLPNNGTKLREMVIENASRKWSSAV